jgi:hypothetical protein
MRTNIALLRDQVEAIEHRFVQNRAKVTPLGWGIPLEHGAIHEWVGLQRTPTVREGFSNPPGPEDSAPSRSRLVQASRLMDTRLAQSGVLSILIGIAHRLIVGADPGLRVFWIGRRVHPYIPALVHPAGMSTDLLERSVFVDPDDRAACVWAMDLCLRSRAAVAVVGDGSALTMAQSRRLQLAAGAGQSIGLIVRPQRDSGLISAARTRWTVGPTPSPDTSPRWAIELVRTHGGDMGGAHRWVVRVDDETGTLRLDERTDGRCAASVRAQSESA